jgi:hypothetical protein
MKPVLDAFGQLLLKNTLPGKQAIEELRQQHPVLNSRGWRNIKDFCRNRMRTKDPLRY